MRIAYRLSLIAGIVASLGFSACIARAESVSFPSAGGETITGYLARPSGTGPYPAVLVLHGCEGYGSLETSTVNELAASGYVALAIDTLAPQGLRNACSAGAGPIRNGIGFAESALAWLRTQPGVDAGHLGVVGYSMGAIESLGLIDPLSGSPPNIPGLRAVVAYYPACSGRSPNIATPLLVLDGSADDWIPPAPCQALAQSAQALRRPVQIVTYPGATHAFNQPSSHPRTVNGHTLVYDPSATADADARMKAFFQQYLH